MKTIIDFNFQFSVWLSIAGGIFILYANTWAFPDTEGILGPLRNNLIVVTSYLSGAQFLIWLVRYRHNGRLEALAMGAVFLLVALGMYYYAATHYLPMNNIVLYIMVYVGVSHILYFYFDSRRIPTY